MLHSRLQRYIIAAGSRVRAFALNRINMASQLKRNSQFYTVWEEIQYYTYTSSLGKTCEPHLNLFNDVKIRELWVIRLLSFLSYSRKSHHNREPPPATAL